MRIDELDGAALDYWCARALCADAEDTLRFTAVAPTVIVTAACDALRRLDAQFAPSASWADAGAVLDRVVDLRVAQRGGDVVECDACFVDGPSTCGAHGPNARIALLRAFVRARFGDTVDTPPTFAHRIERGAVVRYDPGTPIPETDRDLATGDSTDIRSVPRM
ncbi:phage protein NinX family protein [Burkholderia cenocepacia]|uniref:phage protein NinX family protein n=1 Tax=Burkholderia pseudomultivorans TaxID=1207504 RepID=UPI00075542BF|nr:phage protein NinX family protein [Burkholderia pseudomultivorans]KWI57821.1 2-oxoglutarate dehydrogenase [Burkholderia pseudomultivorans]